MIIWLAWANIRIQQRALIAHATINNQMMPWFDKRAEAGFAFDLAARQRAVARVGMD
jgi:hypothetical protein